MLSGLIFYLFALVLLSAAAMVITAKNPVHSVLFLILAFFNAAGLFVMIGAEFIAMTLVIVYVGAVAVLFLFVVMMLDISFADLRKGAMQYVPMGLLLGGILLFELVTVYAGLPGALNLSREAADVPIPENVQNTKALGAVLYTTYLLPFQISGLILLVAMVGAIVLTHRERVGVRRQSVGSQVARRGRDAMALEKPETGKGIADA